MKGSFIAQGAELAAAVQYAAKWLDTKPAIPVLGGLVLDVSDGKLMIGAQSELAAARATIDVTGDAEGRVIVSGRLLAQIVATLADKPITFEQTGSAVSLKAGTYRSNLPAMSESDYPRLASLATEVGTVDGAALIDAVRRVGVSSAKDGTVGSLLTGMHVTFDQMDVEAGDVAYSLTLNGTDRLRASREAVPWEPYDNAPIGKAFTVPASVLLDAGEAFGGGGPVVLGWSEHVVSLSAPTRSVVTRTVGKAADYPALSVLFDQFPQRTHQATIAVKDLMIPLKRADLLAETDYRHIMLDLRRDMLTLRASTEGKGEGGEDIEIEYDGPDCTIVTRSAILHGALATVPGDTVVLHLTPGAYQSVFATSPANPAWTHLFMPIRHV